MRILDEGFLNRLTMLKEGVEPNVFYLTKKDFIRLKEQEHFLSIATFGDTFLGMKLYETEHQKESKQTFKVPFTA